MFEKIKLFILLFFAVPSVIFSEDLAESFSDQHGIIFKRIHMYDYKKNSVKNVSFSYKNPTQDISINSLQNNLANPPNQTTEAENDEGRGQTYNDNSQYVNNVGYLM